MEYISYPTMVGKIVKRERKQRKMTQEEFYSYIYPGVLKGPENIKKKMNAIENGKNAYVDFEFLEVFSKKCNLSMDYIFGKTSYKNYDLKSVCEYTGLEEKTIEQLHLWSVASKYNVDMSILNRAYTTPNEDDEYNKAAEKRTGIEFLKIINYLFHEGKYKENSKNIIERRFSNLSILHSIYLMTMEEPRTIWGRLSETESFDYDEFVNFIPKDHIPLDASQYLSMTDSNGVFYPFLPKDIFKQIAKNHLMRAIERMIEQISKEKTKKI